MALFGRKKQVDKVQSAQYVRRVFAEKIIFSSEEVKNYYYQIKTSLCNIKDCKSKLTRNADSFYHNKIKFAEISFSGKSLKLALNLPFENIPRHYFAKEIKNKFLLSYIKITSNRALNYALELICKTAVFNNFDTVSTQIDTMGLIEDYLINRS